MIDIDVKHFEDQPVRIVDRDGEPWFVARDVCHVLGINDVTSALRNLESFEKSQVTPNPRTERSGGPPLRPMNVVNESGLYAVMFQSRKPEAKRFRRWVTSEVLPSIRRDGLYIAPGAESEMIPRPDFITQVNQRHLEQSSEFMRTMGKYYVDGRRKHVPGRTYVVMVTDDQFKVGTTEALDLVAGTLNRLKSGLREGRHGPMIRLISGGHTREYEVMDKLREFRTNDGVDWFAANEESLRMVQEYPWAKGSRQVVDAYNVQSVAAVQKAIAASAAKELAA